MPRIWVDSTIAARHLSNSDEKRAQVYATIDDHGFDWQVFLVAASGFLTDSYNLFATNVILPSLRYVYWHGDASQWREISINTTTLAGSAIGQLLFGILADKYGRRKLYGLELIIVSVCCLGLSQASAGVDGSMDIMGWLLFYRLFQGIGVGAEYPLSAVITAEFASKKARARMLAAVFLMQPIGQLLAALVGYGVAAGYNNDSTASIDRTWRWVIGVGAIPAFVAIIFRLTIPESPRYTLDVDIDPRRALVDTVRYFGVESSSSSVNMHNMAQPDMRRQSEEIADDDSIQPRANVAALHALSTSPRPNFFQALIKYLRISGHWKRLLGVSVCWFLLDFAYYGIGINNPPILAEIFASTTYNTSSNTATPTICSLTSYKSSCTITSTLKTNALRSIITTSIGTLLGSLLLTKLIPYLPRRTLLIYSFLAVFVLLLVTGATFKTVILTNLHGVTITLYVLTQMAFNLGPNGLLFIIPAEIFPTRYRATCYGIAAASGKISSVLAQVIVSYARFEGTKGDREVGEVGVAAPDSIGLGWVLIIFSFLMLIGAGVAWGLVPEVQEGRGGDGQGRKWEIPSKSLEELAEGWGVDEPVSNDIRLGRRREVKEPRTSFTPSDEARRSGYKTTIV